MTTPRAKCGGGSAKSSAVNYPQRVRQRLAMEKLDNSDVTQRPAGRPRGLLLKPNYEH